MLKTLIAWLRAKKERRAAQRYARRFNAGHAAALRDLDDYVNHGATEAEAVDMVVGRAFQGDTPYYMGARFGVRGWQARRLLARRNQRELEAYERKYQEQNRT